jgi:1-deoxy-D-xylulose-5-phosphate reductoisomerase
LMNKGLEVIEAHHLFAIGSERIEVAVHPQSLVHSLVEFVDGSMLAQLGMPDMRTSLAVGLGWPQRIESGVSGLDLLAHGRLDFEAPDRAAFPCLDLARRAMEAGGIATAVLNAANEVAVDAFLQGQIGFAAIPAVVEHTLGLITDGEHDSVAALLDADARARHAARLALTRYQNA